MKISIIICVILSFSIQSFSQEYSILSYNVENLFDVDDAPASNDEEFTPAGDRHWTHKRFRQKITNISKVILNSNGWTPPALVALCEIENRYVLNQLLTETPLQSFPYKIIHKDSPDQRGIDVALIYNENEFYPLEYKYTPIRLSEDSVLDSREILYVSGIVRNTDTLHLFANHWPSRYSGIMESQPKRNLAAQTLRNEVTALQKKYHNPKIIIVGDFNDQPTDESVKDYLEALATSGENQQINKNSLYNLSSSWVNKEPGTIKYQSQWSVFDQVIVSGSLLHSENGLSTKADWAEIIRLPFLLENDERYGGQKPTRTYNGFRYNGGFSDHLPVLVKLQTEN
ncbi:Endonuclease/Exonuclease/phosphatase family protein [Mariniphaga anaerophila]|uniref:Endonuclease/Exonuclease/phosphatase family protein n=1 Tax=Mariniphaga anaerophila TaxID=1484053 RepID=A0A1M4Y1C9_9BACT|nr:hypothetical protein [Mariniphaga anaerophila]SHE99396.1 Endonuclease/Exonuclease/phosphatase family protein [Mariniphaga anaerophila]